MFLTQRRKGAKKILRNAAALCVFAPLREKFLNLDYVVESGTLSFQSKLFGDDSAERRSRAVFTMRDDRARTRRRDHAEPVKQITLSGMCAEAAHRMNRCAHRYLFAKYSYRLRTLDQFSPECSL